MTFRSITSSSRPMDSGAPIEPMTAEDERFWELRRNGGPCEPDGKGYAVAIILFVAAMFTLGAYALARSL